MAQAPRFFSFSDPVFKCFNLIILRGIEDFSSFGRTVNHIYSKNDIRDVFAVASAYVFQLLMVKGIDFIFEFAAFHVNSSFYASAYLYLWLICLLFKVAVSAAIADISIEYAMILYLNFIRQMTLYGIKIQPALTFKAVFIIAFCKQSETCPVLQFHYGRDFIPSLRHFFHFLETERAIELSCPFIFRFI